MDQRLIQHAIDAAVGFLLRHRDADGWWQDFRLGPGPADEWVTAYVGAALANVDDARAQAAAQQAWQLLLHRRRAEGGWGYNALVPADADSTAWALRLAVALGEHGRGRTLLAARFLARHQRADGGVATYADETFIRRFIKANQATSLAGWCGSHPCVTAVAARLPALVPELEQFSARACAYLQAIQTPEGGWHSYWWQDDAYTTAFAVDVLKRDPHDWSHVSRAIARARERLAMSASTPRAEPAPDAPADPQAWGAFSEALLLRVLAVAPDIALNDRLWIRTLARLLAYQRADGSWPASAWLRVPYPDAITPQTGTAYRLHGRYEGSLSLDYNAVFTTATVLTTLARSLALAHHPLIPERWPLVPRSGDQPSITGDHDEQRKSVSA